MKVEATNQNQDLATAFTSLSLETARFTGAAAKDDPRTQDLLIETWREMAEARLENEREPSQTVSVDIPEAKLAHRVRERGGSDRVIQAVTDTAFIHEDLSERVWKFGQESAGQKPAAETSPVEERGKETAEQDHAATEAELSTQTPIKPETTSTQKDVENSADSTLKNQHNAFVLEFLKRRYNNAA
ncbi:MAG: hypothetical protein D6808_05480 [Candidatus Dadabacteria bacterium]|nr:MAG: hypothetical protein D6808_05480 [Candidatus Dadabacteria bacterium]